MFHTKFNILFPHLVLLEMIFWRRYFKQSYRIFQYNVNNLNTRFCPLASRTSGGLRLKSNHRDNEAYDGSVNKMNTCSLKEWEAAYTARLEKRLLDE